LKRTISALILALLQGAAGLRAGTPGAPVLGADLLQKSLVKIFTTAQEPDYYEPWRVQPQHSMSGSGCVIAGNRILTNAHVVANAIFIQVLKDGDSKKYLAHQEFVAHDCDLALLKVDDPDFFKGTLPASFGTLPFKRDKVAVYGFPLGGEELSITEGVVSRIEIATYSHSMRNLLEVQTDAAINPGNSGGPVFKDRKMVGVAFQGYSGAVAQNTSYFVPITLVERFLRVVKQGSYKGIPALGVYCEAMENDSLRDEFGMKPGQTGILVSKVIYGSSAWDHLKENDVILSIDGFAIGNDRTVAFRKGERINFAYPLCLHQIGDSMEFKILRDKKPMTLSLTLKEDVHLVPLVAYDVQPTYFIFDGLIFTPFNLNFPGISSDTPSELKALYFHGLPSPERKEVVLLNHILSNEINKGYDQQFTELIVSKVNGHPISEMKDLIAAFADPKDGRHLIEIDKPKEVGTKIVLDAASSAKASAEILDQYGIPSDRSPDLKEQP
jgi:S1-C subfamily serine protease